MLNKTIPSERAPRSLRVDELISSQRECGRCSYWSNFQARISQREKQLVAKCLIAPANHRAGVWRKEFDECARFVEGEPVDLESEDAV